MNAYDVFLSYSSPDAEIVKAIGAALQRQRFAVFVDDWRVTPGAPYHPELMTALETSRAVAVCYGASPPRDYHQLEINAAIARAAHSQTRAIPVLLPGGDLKHVDPALGTHNVITFKGAKDRDALWRLECGIRGRAPGEGPPEDYLDEGSAAPGQSDAPADDGDVQAAVAVVVGALSKGRNVAFFVGGRATPEPTEFEVTARLLNDFQLGRGRLVAPSPTLNTAATYYDLSSSPQLLENEVADLIVEKRDAASQPLLLLARLLKYMVSRYAAGSRRPTAAPLVVTTCLDVGLERALLRAGVSFVRMVQRRPTDAGPPPRLVFNEYCLTAGPGGAPALAGWTGALTTMTELDDAIGKCGYREVDASPEAARRPEEGSACGPEAPIVYKFHGSCDVPGSCTLSTDHYLTSGTRKERVPAKVLGIVAQTPPLILGYGPADPAFRHLYLTLKEAFTPGTGYWVWAAPRRPTRDPYDLVDAWLRGRNRSNMGPRHGFQVLPTNEVTFLGAVLQGLGVSGV